MFYIRHACGGCSYSGVTACDCFPGLFESVSESPVAHSHRKHVHRDPGSITASPPLTISLFFGPHPLFFFFADNYRSFRISPRRLLNNWDCEHRAGAFRCTRFCMVFRLDGSENYGPYWDSRVPPQGGCGLALFGRPTQTVMKRSSSSETVSFLLVLRAVGLDDFSIHPSMRLSSMTYDTVHGLWGPGDSHRTQGRNKFNTLKSLILCQIS